MGCQSTMQTKDDLTNNLNKELCKSIYSSLPERKNTDLQNFKQIIRTKTLKCSQKEKYFIIYLWICEYRL